MRSPWRPLIGLTLCDTEAALPWWKRCRQLSNDDYESERGRSVVEQVFRRPPVLVRVASFYFGVVPQYHLLRTIEELDRVLAGVDFQAQVAVRSVQDLGWGEGSRGGGSLGVVFVLFNDRLGSASQQVDDGVA